MATESIDTVHLVNLTNPMMMKGPFREFIPSAPRKCAYDCRMEESKKDLVSGLRQGRQGKSIGQYLGLVVPSILDHEVVAIEL